MTAEELQLRRAIVCGSGLLYWVGVLVQARRVRKQIGRAPNVRPGGVKERALWFGWFLVILSWVGQPLLVGTAVRTPGLYLMDWLTDWAGFAAGLAMIILGYGGTLWSYHVMGNSWRMGVKEQERTELIRRGPFKWIRHPIYALQVLMLLGTALLLPTPVSFVMVAVHYLCVRIKAQDEERHLDRIHGLAYRDYASKTGGLCPNLIGKRATRRDDLHTDS